MADWSNIEVELIVADYFSMLKAELIGQPFNKTEHRNKLRPLLNNRPDGALEFKHRNISAVLMKHGYPNIVGYKASWNYQMLLEEVVLAHLSQNQEYFKLFERFAAQEIESLETQVRFDSWLVAPPKPSNMVAEAKTEYFTPVKKNYLELEQRNMSVGMNGEKLVYEYEKWWLDKVGHPKLAKEVKWVSRDQGDGAGYDILSKDASGEDKFIEVKTTTLGKDTPIFFTKRENDFSMHKQGAFHLYRVFELSKSPKMFTRSGRFEDFCAVESVGFKGVF